MELIAVLFMIVAGGAVAVIVFSAMALARGEARHAGAASARASRDEIAASLLYHVLISGGVAPDAALRQLRRDAGIAARVVPGVDVASSGEWYARVTTAGDRSHLLDLAVQLSAHREGPVPLRQYAALLDLSFALGFHTDALARLREKYGFDYIDHARDARPREADRKGGATPLFVRDESETVELLRVLSIDEKAPTRQAIISAYRKLAALHHPDRFYTASNETRSAETQRFIEITHAYEKLLAIYRD